MRIVEFLKQKVLSKLGLIKLNGNPNSERLTYINDAEAIRLSNIKANKIWYLGDGDELLNWYTNQQTYGWAKNPIYNRNKRQYFWGMSVNEMVKRVHSGIPRAIIDTISNIVGMPNITGDDILKDIFEENNFEFMLCQQARPMTLVEGDGAFKINMNPKLSKYPLIEYYSAEDWGPLYKSNILIGMYFKSYYKDKNDKDYVLFETRTLRPEGLAVEYNLYQAGKNDELISCNCDKIPELSGLENKLLSGINCLLAIPNKYYFDPLYVNRGKSIYDGKLDLFDFMDEILTQSGQTNRVSTPVEYYPVDLLERTKNSQPILPKLYNRQYVKIEGTLDGDGNSNNTIQTTQPDLNFDKYGNLFSDVLGNALVGVLSPSSLGIDIAKKDNADAQREKEKQTMFTRNLIIKNETKMLVKLCDMLLMAYEIMTTGIYNNTEYNISVKYDEFALPSFENEIQVLGPAWVSGEISTERYVQLLWAGKLSDEEMLKEIQWLDENKQKDDFDMNSLMEHENETENGLDLQREAEAEEEPAETEE